MNKKVNIRAAIFLVLLLTIVIGVQQFAQAGNGSNIVYLPISARSSTCNVPSATYQTIQSAVDDRCDIINLTAALYTERIVIQDLTVIIRGQGPANTIIDGSNAGWGVSVIFGGEESALTLEGVTITNGEGGGVKSWGTLHLTNIVVKDIHSGGRGGGIAAFGPLTLENSWIMNNTAISSEGYGGGVYINDTAYIANTVISGNSAWYGGGIGAHWSPSMVTIVNSQIVNNHADGGGGILTTYLGNMLIINSVISNNEAESSGGGILNGGKMQVFDSQIVGNTIGKDPWPNSCGGGILNSGGYYEGNDRGDLLIERTEIRDNVAYEDGGGICNMNFVGPFSEIIVRNSLIAGNSALLEGGGFFNWADDDDEYAIIENSTIANNSSNTQGGAVYGKLLQLTNVTVNKNEAPEGGGFYNWGDIQMVNTIVAGNLSGDNCDGGPSAEFTSLGHNISSDNSCDLDGPGDMPNTDPLLGPLQNNGGPTHTTAIPSNSPAKDSADNAACPPTDQRGVIRPQGAGCDIGAYEYNG